MRRLALFDLDGTLIPGDSDHAFCEFLIAIGWADEKEFHRRNDEFFQQYQAGRLDIDRYVDFATAPWRDRPAAELQAARERFMADVMRPQIRAAALELVRSHQAQGDLVAIVTATNEFVTAPLAEAWVKQPSAGRYVCTARGGAVGATTTFSFTLRIDKDIADRGGYVMVTDGDPGRPSRDTKPADDMADVAVSVWPGPAWATPGLYTAAAVVVPLLALAVALSARRRKRSRRREGTAPAGQ